MDPTYRSLIMQRRKQTNRKGFLPAIIGGLAGAKILATLGKSLLGGRKSGYSRRKGDVLYWPARYPRRSGMLIGGRKTATPKYLSNPDLKKWGTVKMNGYTAVNVPRGGRSMPKPRSKGFDRNKGILAKNIIKSHLLGRKRGRKGDLDSSFLGEFGQDVFNPEPTVSKTWGRKAYEALKGVWGSKEAKKIKDQLAKQGERAIVDKISKLSAKKAGTIASKIVEGKPIPATYHKDLIPSSRFLGKYRG